MIAVGIVLGIALLLVGLCRPAAGVGLLAAADLIVMEGLPVGGSTIAVESLFLLYMAAVPLIRWLVDGQNTLPTLDRLRPLTLFALLFAGACLASTLAGGITQDSARMLVRMPLWALFALVPASLLRRAEDLKVAAMVVIGGSLLLLVWGLVQGIPDTEAQGGPWRVGYKNPLGHALALGSIFAYCLSLGSRRPTFLRIAALALAAGTVYTKSRGGMAAGAAALVVCWWIASHGTAKRTAQLACLAAAPVALLALATGIVGQVMNAVINQDSSSNLYRFQIGVLALRLFLANPFLGVGLGNLEAATGSHTSGLRSLATEIIAGDNDYARILAELGAAGMIVLGCAVWKFRSRLRKATNRDREASGFPDVARVMGAGVGTFLAVLGLFESVLFSPTGWFYVGFAWACIGAKRCASSR